jgi:hypothetical protein
MLSISCNDGQFFTVFTERVELVCEGCLDLLTSDVGQLGFCNERLGFGADQLLLKNDNLGRIGLLVLQLRNLIRDLLFPLMLSALKTWPHLVNVLSRLGWTEASMFRMLFIVTRY